MKKAITNSLAFRMAAALLTLAIGGKALAQDAAVQSDAVFTVVTSDNADPTKDAFVISDQDFGRKACAFMNAPVLQNPSDVILRHVVKVALVKNGVSEQFDAYCLAERVAAGKKRRADRVASAKYESAYEKATNECNKRHRWIYACLENDRALIKSHQEQTEANMAATEQYKQVTRQAFIDRFGKELTIKVRLSDYAITISPSGFDFPAP